MKLPGIGINDHAFESAEMVASVPGELPESALMFCVAHADKKIAATTVKRKPVRIFKTFLPSLDAG